MCRGAAASKNRFTATRSDATRSDATRLSVGSRQDAVNCKIVRTILYMDLICLLQAHLCAFLSIAQQELRLARLKETSSGWPLPGYITAVEAGIKGQVPVTYHSSSLLLLDLVACSRK
jgi:hypothetical protein